MLMEGSVVSRRLYSLSRILTITLVVVAVIAVSLMIYIFEENAMNAYGSKISYQITKLPITYDYSCSTNSQLVEVFLANRGNKTVSDFAVSISNPVCVGAVPNTLPSVFNRSSTLVFTLSSIDTNGTITITGNYTLVTINF